MKYCFGGFEVDCASKELRKAGIPIKLGEQPFLILTTLLERAGNEVLREEIQRRVWSNGTHVDFDKSINSAVNKLRDALGDSADRPRYIETIPRKGYRFIARLETGVDSHVANGPRSAPTPSTPRKAWKIAFAASLVLTLVSTAATALVRLNSSPKAVQSLLILPFQSLNAGDAGYLGEGITEQVTAKLAALPGIRVISPAAAKRIGAAGLNPQEAGLRLDAEAVLVGSVRIVNDKIRVNTQMIRSADGNVLWAEGGLDVEGKDLLDAERLLAVGIAGRLIHSLGPAEQSAIARPSTTNVHAYELLVRAKVNLRSNAPARERLGVSQRLLQEAIRLDPNFAEAYAWLALAQHTRFELGHTGDEVRQASLKHARQALALDPSITVARRALIGIFHNTGQAEEGLKEAAILRQSGASDPDSLVAMAQAYLRGGMADRAIPLYQQAIKADPEDQSLPCHLSFAANWAGQYELGLEALKLRTDCHFNRMLNAVGAGRLDIAKSAAYETLRKGTPFSFAVALATLRETGGFETGRQIWRARAADLERGDLRNERVQIGLGMTYALLGEKQKAIEKVRLALEVNPGDPWTLMWAAETYGWLGDDVKVFECLEESVNRGFLSIFYLERVQRLGRGLHPWRSDPRLLAVTDRLAAKIERLRVQY